MIASRMLPAIWLRVVVLIAFGVFVLYQGMWLIGGIIGLLILLSLWQLIYAYREKARNSPQ